jgi:hypothetical protein
MPLDRLETMGNGRSQDLLSGDGNVSALEVAMRGERMVSFEAGNQGTGWVTGRRRGRSV